MKIISEKIKKEEVSDNLDVIHDTLSKFDASPSTDFRNKLKSSLYHLHDEVSGSNQKTNNILMKIKDILNLSNRAKYLAGVFLLLSITASATYFVYNRKNSGTVNTLEAFKKNDGYSEIVKLQSGQALSIPNYWTASSIKDSTEGFKGRFNDLKSNTDDSFYEINTAGLNRNETIVQKQTTISIEGKEVKQLEGKENFLQSERKFSALEVSNSEGKSIMIQSWNPGPDSAATQQEIARSVISGKSQNLPGTASVIQNKGFQFIKSAKASNEDGTIAGFNKKDFNNLTVMGQVLETRIDKTDIKYKDGYAKLYSFQAFRGQLLTAVAAEETQGRSYIYTDLISNDDRLMLTMNTRVEFEAPYTGTYHLIVYTFDNQEGNVRIMVFDRDQTDPKVFIKYSDGKEIFCRINQSGSCLNTKGKTFVIRVEFVNAIESLENSIIKTRSWAKEFEQVNREFIEYTPQLFFENPTSGNQEKIEIEVRKVENRVVEVYAKNTEEIVKNDNLKAIFEAEDEVQEVMGGSATIPRRFSVDIQTK